MVDLIVSLWVLALYTDDDRVGVPPKAEPGLELAAGPVGIWVESRTGRRILTSLPSEARVMTVLKDPTGDREIEAEAKSSR